MKVDFMIIGAQKCGTTTLFEILAKHPQLSPCRPKEPQYFCSTLEWKKKIDEYHLQYDESSDGLFFEGSTTTTFLPCRANYRVWEDLYDYNPDLKFIYIVRNPIDRIISGYMHMWQAGFTGYNDVSKAIKNDRSFIEITRYHTQIMPFINRFGRDRVLILEFEEFIKDKSETLKTVSEFLGIEFEKFEKFENAHWNKTVGPAKKYQTFVKPGIVLRGIRKYLPKIWNRISDNSAREFKEKITLPEDIQQLCLAMLENDIKGMEELLEKDLDYWRKIQ